MPAAVPIAIAAGAVGSALINKSAASSAADAQQAAAQNATQAQLAMYYQSRADQAPWRQGGSQALNALSQWYGLGGIGNASQGTAGQSAVPGYDPSSGYQIGPGGTITQGAQVGGVGGGFGGSASFGGSPLIQGGAQSTGRPTWQQGMPSQTGPAPRPGTPGTSSTGQPIDYNAILSNLPGYQFQLQQGGQAVNQNLAARGLLQSGAAGKELTQFGQGLASNYATQYIAGLQSMAGLGQTAAAQTGAFGMSAANQIGGNMLYGGNAAATGYIGGANAINSGLGSLAGLYGQYQQGAYQRRYDSLQPVSVGGQYTYDPYAPWVSNPGG